MKMIKKTALATFATAAILTAGLAQANTTSAKAAQLGNSLTPMGSEKAGNADGTIPAWDGGITRPPAGYRARPGGRKEVAGELGRYLREEKLDGATMRREDLYELKPARIAPDRYDGFVRFAGAVDDSQAQPMVFDVIGR